MHQTTLRFGPDLWAAVTREAERQGVSVSHYVRDATVSRLALERAPLERGGASVAKTIPDELAVKVVVSGHLHMIILAGELDMPSAPALIDAVARIGEEEQMTVVIDLGQLTFMDSSGLRALFNAYQHCRARGHELLIIPGPESVQRLFELTGTDQLLPFTDAPTLDTEASHQRGDSSPSPGGEQARAPDHH